MKNNKGFLYSSKSILLFIIVISVLMSLLTQAPIEFFNNTVDSSIFYSNLYNDINVSLYGGQSRDTGRLLNYYIRSEKFVSKNIEEDNLFEENVEEIGQNGEEISYSIDEERGLFERTTVHPDGSIEISLSEEPFISSSLENKEVLKTSYLTNDRLFQRNYGRDFSFDTESIEFKEGYGVIRGTFDGENVVFNLDNSNVDQSRESNIALDTLESVVEDVYLSIDEDSSIQNLDFAYAMDVSSPQFYNYVNTNLARRALIPKVIIFSLLGMFIFLVFSSISKYEKMKESKFYISVSRFPVEVSLLLLAILVGVFGVSFSDLIYNSTRGFHPVGQGLFQALGLFFSGIFIYYFIFSIKDIFNKGRNSLIIRNSIIFKIYDKIFKGRINKLTDNMEGTNKRTVAIAYGVLIFIGFIGVNLFVNYGFRFIVFILWAILITGIFAFFKKYYDDIIRIEEVSKNIALGNYEIKLDEENSKFKTLAHNLNTVSENLDLAVENAVKSERMKTELITNVSHDLKTPLTSIINYSELLVDDSLNIEDQKSYANIINEKSHKLRVLIENLFEISKVSSRNIELNKEDLDFSQLVEQIIGEWEDKLTEKNISTNLIIPEKPIILNLDGNQTYRVLENVFSNIYKYTLENTRVYVDLLKKENGAELIVKNISKYPLNITPDELKERFTRGDASRNTEGSGLGLSIASSLTEIQGGEFKIDIDGDLFKITIKF